MKRFLLISMCLFGALLSACVPAGKSPTKNADYHYLMGSSYLEEGRPTMALQEFLIAEKLDDQRIEIHSGLAQAYMSKRAYDLAEKHYLKALKLSGGEPEYHNNLGALYLSMERYEDSAASFQTAAENLLFLIPEVAWTGLGFANFQMNNYPAAERAYKRAAEINPGYVQSFFRLGELYYTQDRPVEAAEAFSTAVKLVPNFVDGHYRLGLAHMKARNTDQARQAFLEVVRLSPESEQARLATSYLKILQ
jgi:Tfp pilus assembly protein PilF